jgi:transcriptional regulator with XRE-family HTH domain
MAIKTPLVTNQPEIGILIRELRLETGLTQEKFGASLGVSYPTVSRWENGVAKPSPLAIQKIEKRLRQIGDRRKDLLDKYLRE